MKLSSAYKTHRGMVSSHNEDFVWVSEADHIYVVTDGMGGHEGGELASRMAAVSIGETLQAALAENRQPASEQIKTWLTNALEAANTLVFNASEKAHQTLRMGATVVTALIVKDTAYISHAGDARAYLLRENSIIPLTDDDSWLAHLVAEGIMSKEDSKDSQIGHVITKAIGQEEALEPSFKAVALQSGDWLLLCSDGLWNMLDDAQILTHFQANPKPETLVKALVASANSAGGKDNISVAAVRVG